MAEVKNIAILGASGYTGCELIRILYNHPMIRIVALSANRKADLSIDTVFPHMHYLNLPRLVKITDINFSNIDLIFCALPHGVMHQQIKHLSPSIKIVDLSADFRLRDGVVYQEWYGLKHQALDIQSQVVYGLPEFYRKEISAAQIVANTGCYVASILLPLIPLLQERVISFDDIIIDAASGVSGAGRGLNEANLFCEVADGYHAYAVGGHRHIAEIEQELSRAAGNKLQVSFTPHLLPQIRGILATIYVRGDSDILYTTLKRIYQSEQFVHILPIGTMPATRYVRGSNLCMIGVKADKIPGRTIIISTLDNLMKGAAGQAVQNANLMLGLPEGMGLDMLPLFP